MTNRLLIMILLIMYMYVLPLGIVSTYVKSKLADLRLRCVEC